MEHYDYHLNYALEVACNNAEFSEFFDTHTIDEVVAKIYNLLHAIWYA